jgi:predicted DNA-binding protein (MmcQ/YjbR family)
MLMRNSGVATSKRSTDSIARAETTLAAHAQAFPEVTEHRPWGHRAFKVNKKVFLFLGGDPNGLSLSVKLPKSRGVALEEPFAEPTHYGLGRSGWVTASFASGDSVPLPLLQAWIDESFAAIAPKRLSREPAPQAKPGRKKSAPAGAKKTKASPGRAKLSPASAPKPKSARKSVKTKNPR